MTEPRKGQAPAVLKRDEFHLEFRRSFFDPSFDAVQTEIAKVEQVAWENTMHPEIHELAELVESTSRLLGKYGEDGWSVWLAKDAVLIRGLDFYGVERFA